MKHGHRLATHDTPRAVPLRRAVLARGCSGWVLLAASLAAMNTSAQESPAQSTPPRLTVSEDGTLVIKRGVPPGVDLTLFPAAPGTWHWSSSTRIRSGTVNAYNYGNTMQGSSGGPSSQLGSFKLGWAVDMTTGEASGDVAKSSRLPVRLIRSYE